MKDVKGDHELNSYENPKNKTFPEQRESLMSRVVEALVDYVSGFPIQTKTIKGPLLYDVPGLHKQYNFYIYYQKYFQPFLFW